MVVAISVRGRCESPHAIRIVMGSDDSLGRPASSGDVPPLPLALDEVHVWVVSLDPQSALASRQVAAVTPAERERAGWFQRREHGEQYLLARGALRLLLADYLACDPAAVHFRTGEHGKPFLEHTRLEFNLSHSGSLALIGVTRDRRVGVDVEQIRPTPNLLDVADRICTASELATVKRLPEQDRERVFFAIWTRKEALAKATGEGIAGIFRGGREETLQDGLSWTVSELTDLPGYAACVAAEGSGWRLVRRTPSWKR